jgi:hypothetical protein
MKTETWIDKSDVIRIAESIGVVLSLKKIKQIIEEHDDECDNDPTGTWDLVVENQIHQYMYGVQKNQKYFNDYSDLLQSVDKDAYNKQITAGIRSIEKFSKELKTDYFVDQSLKMVNQNKYLLFSENVKHIMLDMNDKILHKNFYIKNLILRLVYQRNKKHFTVFYQSVCFRKKLFSRVVI